MKDEELAKEYRKSLKQRLIDEDNFERLEMFDENVEEAFLAGLKAKTQWHDLRKAPNDLPNDSRIVSDQEGNNVRYVKHLNKWFYRHITCKANVIAWCELPTFDKE